MAILVARSMIRESRSRLYGLIYLGNLAPGLACRWNSLDTGFVYSG